MIIRQALEAYLPKLEAAVVARLTYSFEEITRLFGPAHRGVYNSTRGKFYAATLQPVTTRAGNTFSDPVSLDAAKLTAFAQASALATIDAWEAKLTEKVGDLDEPTVKHGGGYMFLVIGYRKGKRVVIEQDMILNVSAKGNLFNQFPARIYLEGKFISAAKFALI